MTQHSPPVVIFPSSFKLETNLDTSSLTNIFHSPNLSCSSSLRCMIYQYWDLLHVLLSAFLYASFPGAIVALSFFVLHKIMFLSLPISGSHWSILITCIFSKGNVMILFLDWQWKRLPATVKPISATYLIGCLLYLFLTNNQIQGFST